jgi:hypothetical protein
VHAYLSIVPYINALLIELKLTDDKMSMRGRAEQCPSDTDGEIAMHACAARAGPRAHGTFPPSRARSQCHMRCEQWSHVAWDWEGSGNGTCTSATSPLVSLSWTRRTSHPSIQMQRTQATADGSHSCVTPMDADDLMPIWTRNIVWIPDQGHSSAVINRGYTCIENDIDITADRCLGPYACSTGLYPCNVCRYDWINNYYFYLDIYSTCRRQSATWRESVTNALLTFYRLYLSPVSPVVEVYIAISIWNNGGLIPNEVHGNDPAQSVSCSCGAGCPMEYYVSPWQIFGIVSYKCSGEKKNAPLFRWRPNT